MTERMPSNRNHGHPLKRGIDKEFEWVSAIFPPYRSPRAETTSAKNLLPLLAKTMVFVATKGSTPTNFATSLRTTVDWHVFRLAPIEQPIAGTIQSSIESVI